MSILYANNAETKLASILADDDLSLQVETR